MHDLAYKVATNILLIEDTASDAELLRSCLEDTEEESFHVTHVPNMTSALPLLAERNIHAVMLDLMLPDTEQLDGLQGVQAMAPDVPVVILTGRDDENLANEAVTKGAQDYLLKDKIDARTLQRSIHYAIRRKQHESAIIFRAHYDSLTGLPNRALFNDRLTVALARQQRSGQHVALMMLDLNGFKKINDKYGHAAGDAVLREIGRRIPHCLRPYDVAGRLGGDEFVVLIEDVQNPRNRARVASKLIEVIERPMIAGSRQINVGASIGIAVSEGGEPGTDAKTLMQAADAAMYRAKSRKTSAYEFAETPAAPHTKAQRGLEA